MNIMSTIVLVMAGMTFIVGLFSLNIYPKFRTSRAGLTFGIMCILLTVYDVLCAGLYSARTPATGMLWSQAQDVALTLFSAVFIGFFVDYTGIKANALLKGIAVFFVVTAFIFAFDRSNLTIIRDVPLIKTVYLPYGATVVYNEMKAGPFSIVEYLVSIGVMIYLFILAIRMKRDRLGRSIRPLLWGMALFFAGSLNDIFVSLGAYRAIYVLEYAYLGLIVLMAETLTHRLVKAASTSEALSLSEKRLVSVLESAAAEKERLAVTLRSIGDGVIATDTAGTIVVINPVAEKLTNWTEESALGKPFGTVVTLINEMTREPCPDPVEQVLASGGVNAPSNHTLLIARDGTQHCVADNGSPIRRADGTVVGVVMVLRDVTAKRKFEEELSRAQKLDSLGILAGGIAHDFNNLLTGILGNVSLAHHLAASHDEIGQLLGEAEFASMQAKRLTFQLLTFARGGAPIRKAVAVQSLIEEAARFALRGSKSRARFDLPAGLWPLDADEGQVGQVVSNLVINADQAMPGGGTIVIGAANSTIGENDEAPLLPGRYVRLTFKDAGVGIRKDDLPKVFDPFYTTKQKGSGLGLSISYSIVRKHGGHISVVSETGAGSAFTVFLPASSALVAFEHEATTATLENSGSVLVVDDEEIIRRTAVHLLSNAGFTVEAVADGGSAIERYAERYRGGNPFDAVILDLTIPGDMGGAEIVLKLKQLDPAVKAIVSSGYSNDPVMAHYRDHGFSGVIAKPYSIEELAATVRRVIDQNSALPG